MIDGTGNGSVGIVLGHPNVGNPSGPTDGVGVGVGVGEGSGVGVGGV